MLSIFGFLIILGPLVIVHEFGHYIFARIFNVKAEIFSVGFGPKLWSKQLGETELRFSLFPMGGYVKLLGEDPDVQLSPEDLPRALQRQAPWKRFFIFFGGPLFNFLFAILIFMAILAIGEPQIASVIGRVARGSAAEKAGFHSGDRIVAIDGKEVRRFDEVIVAINESPNKALRFELESDGAAKAKREVSATPAIQDGFSVYGEATHVGEIDGMLPAARANTLGVSNPDSAAGKAGLKTGQRIVSYNGTPTPTWELLEAFFESDKPGNAFVLKVADTDGKNEHDVTLSKSGATLADLGIHSTELFIDKPAEKSPAEAAGIQTGDRIVKVSGEAVASFFALKDAIQRAGEKSGKVDVEWERAGKTMAATINPTATAGRDPVLKKITQYTIGVIPMMSWADPAIVIERIWNPILLVYKGTERMVVFTWRNFVSLKKMLTGDVSVATLGGPILIGKIAGESLSRGLVAFLSTMAVLSVGLGVLNVLPIPVLDGGHLMLLTIEIFRKRPLTIRQMEIVQQVGLSLILLLMVIVIKNDLTRLPLFQ